MRLFTYGQISALLDEAMGKYRQNSDESIALTDEIIRGASSHENTLRATRMAARAVGNLEIIHLIQEKITESLAEGGDNG